MSRASVVKSVCLGAAVVALTWLALGCGSDSTGIIAGTDPTGTLADQMTGSLAFEVFVDPTTGTVEVNSDSKATTESPLIPNTPGMTSPEVALSAAAVPLNGFFDPRRSLAPVWLVVTNLLDQDINDVIVVPGNYSGRNTTGNTNAAIPNVLNLQPFGLLNNDIVAQFGNQPIQGDGFTTRTMLGYWYWYGGAWPEREVGDPAMSPRDNPEFYQTLDRMAVGQDCWQLVPNPLYNMDNDTGFEDDGVTPATDGIPHDSRLKPFNVDDDGNYEAQIRPCSGSKMTVPNCISAVWIGQIEGQGSEQFVMEIRDPTAAAFSFTAVVWASRWRNQNLLDNPEGSADFNYNGVSAQSVVKAVAVGEADTPDDNVMISMTTDGLNWFRQNVVDDDGRDTDFAANLNSVWLNKTRKVGAVNPVTADLSMDTLPGVVEEVGHFGCTVGVALSGANRMVLRTLGTDDWMRADEQVLPRDNGMTAHQPLNDVTAAVENGFSGRIFDAAGVRIHEYIPSTVLIAVGDTRGPEISGGIMVSTDCGDTWYFDARNRRGDRTRNQASGGDRYSAPGLPQNINILSVCADPKPTGVRIGEVQFDLADLPDLADMSGDDVIHAVWASTGALGDFSIAPLLLEQSGQMANNHRVFIGTAGGEVLYSDDCITPVYTPLQGGIGDEIPNDPFGGFAPDCPIPLQVPAVYTPANRSAWQATWATAGGTGTDMVLDLECCEVLNPAAEFQTDLIVMGVTDGGRFLFCEDGRAAPPWTITRLLGDEDTKGEAPGGGDEPQNVPGVVRVAGVGGGDVEFLADTAVQGLVGSSPRAGHKGRTDLRGVSCNPWDLCPQALNDNDYWYPTATGDALQVWIVGQQSDAAPTYNGIPQPIVLHNPALVSSVPAGWPVPVGTTVPQNGVTLDPEQGTVSALVENKAIEFGTAGASSTVAGGFWTIQNPQANVQDPVVGELAGDLNDVDCVNPLGVKEEFQRIVVPGFPNDKAPVVRVDLDGDGVPDDIDNPYPVEITPIGPFEVEAPGWRWVDLDGDGEMDYEEVFAVVIVPDALAPLIWPTCWAVGGLPGVNQDNGPPGYAYHGQPPYEVEPFDAVNLIFPGLSENTTSLGVIRSYF